MRSDGPVIGFAHRGARAHAPENTIEAFLTALRMGASALETDVWTTRDGVVVIDHDGLVDGRTPVSSVDFADLPSRMPSLWDLQSVIPPDTHLSIDLKDPEAFEPVLAIRREAGDTARSRTWLCHPDPARLARWRPRDARVRLVASPGRRRVRPADLAQIGVDVLNLRHHRWSRRRIRDTHDAGLAAFAWGVQCPARMRTLVNWGIDAIYSDHTDRMVRVLQPLEVTERPDDHEGPAHQ